MDWKDRRLIRNLYLRQKVNVQIGKESREGIEIGRGVTQGCCMSPNLFNIYFDDLIRKCFDKTRGVTVSYTHLANAV